MDPTPHDRPIKGSHIYIQDLHIYDGQVAEFTVNFL